MQVRTITMGPEDQLRLRELLKIHEAEIDSMTDDELDVLEQATSDRLQRLLETHDNPQPLSNVRPLRIPMKTGTVAFLAAAAALVFVHMQFRNPIAFEPEMVSKGLEPASAVSCESSIVESDGTTPAFDQNVYTVPAGKSSYLKLHCGRPVYVHIGVMKGDSLHLELQNLSVSPAEKVVMRGLDRVDFTALVARQANTVVLVTEKPISVSELGAKDRNGFWMEDVPLKIQR